MFSKVANDKALGAALDTGTGATVIKADANEVIGRAVAGFGGRIPGVTFKVVPTFDVLPDAIIKAATDQETGATGRDYGTPRNGTVYLLLDSHKTEQHVKESVLHSLYGHADQLIFFVHSIACYALAQGGEQVSRQGAGCEELDRG